MRILLSSVINADAPTDINNLVLRAGTASLRSIFEDVTLVDSHLLRDAEIERLRPSVYDTLASEEHARELFLKTHDAFTFLADGTPSLGRSARAAIHVVRDPRDVFASLTHFFDGHADEALTMLNDAGSRLAVADAFHLEQRVNGWSGHTASWLEQRVVPTIVVRYEDLVSDSGRELRHVLDHVGLVACDEDVQRAARSARFEELQRQEREHGFLEKPPTAPVFFREGRVGAWREHLTSEQVGAIEQAHGPLMTRLGYL